MNREPQVPKPEQPLGLDVKQSPTAQDVFRPISGLISYAVYVQSCVCVVYMCVYVRVCLLQERHLCPCTTSIDLACPAELPQISSLLSI